MQLLGATYPLDATNPMLGATNPLMHNFRPCLKCACPITTSTVIHTFLFLALGKLDVLDYLVNELGVDPVARDKSGMSCVHAATQGGQPNAIKVRSWQLHDIMPHALYIIVICETVNTIM